MNEKKLERMILYKKMIELYFRPIYIGIIRMKKEK